MQSLEKRLKNELQQNNKIKIMYSNTWSLPIHSIEVEYRPVKRTKMDILMKMMLMAFQKAEIAKAEQLSEILLVEQLFVEDLIDIMGRTGLITKNYGLFSLTNKGNHQLENGIFEEEQEVETQVVLYSTTHENFLNGNIKTAMDGEGELAIYRYVKEGYLDVELSFDKEQIIEALQAKDVEGEEGDIQVVISEIQSTTELYVDDIPCFEFVLHNKEEDVFYARVWNTLLERWDEKLENALNDKERLTWREKYLSK
ncbi:hypothetical protein [Psychrobacillus lasiicapitis]|uniref:Uncharacterized protein n=1 Tax=Psychrobacillus lasiicapitis TaxID=1636719 RepID=A0A544SX76_9BACI|nr:hypothetical protein [Psychrobacillus lasiicapitis]TQR09813.1 hypothetical protein FG382_18935 [Psychrobacillus lasiicapitis]GGA23771.1 hypothetical protein GCM10011384_11740 [Psychrobacillus lasiicapitis]